MTMLSARVAGLFALLGLASPGWAGSVQLWPTGSVNAPIAGAWRGQVDLTARTRGGYANGQLNARFTLLHPLTRHITVGGGYVRVANYPAMGSAVAEDQLFEQLGIELLDGPARLTARTRLEQRFQPGVDETSWRLRQQVKLIVPVGHHGLRVSTFVEPFFDLNRTARTQQNFDQVRSFAGLNILLGRGTTLEIGYLGQYLHRPTGDDWVHAVPMTLSVRL